MAKPVFCKNKKEKTFFFFKLLASEFVFTQHAKRQVIVQVVENQFKEACITLSPEYLLLFGKQNLFIFNRLFVVQNYRPK